MPEVIEDFWGRAVNLMQDIIFLKEVYCTCHYNIPVKVMHIAVGDLIISEL